MSDGSIRREKFTFDFFEYSIIVGIYELSRRLEPTCSGIKKPKKTLNRLLRALVNNIKEAATSVLAFFICNLLS